MKNGKNTAEMCIISFDDDLNNSVILSSSSPNFETEIDEIFNIMLENIKYPENLDDVPYKKRTGKSLYTLRGDESIEEIDQKIKEALISLIKD
jgi:hypothetical protein